MKTKNSTTIIKVKRGFILIHHTAIAKKREWFYLANAPKGMEILQQPDEPLSDEVWKMSGAKKIIASSFLLDGVPLRKLS